jgi:hypothetical protein
VLGSNIIYDIACLISFIIVKKKTTSVSNVCKDHHNSGNDTEKKQKSLVELEMSANL